MSKSIPLLNLENKLIQYSQAFELAEFDHVTTSISKYIFWLVLENFAYYAYTVGFHLPTIFYATKKLCLQNLDINANTGIE